MDYKLLLDTAVMAGEILLESGAETWRVEDTMLRMLRMSGLKTADVLALTTGFVVTLDDPAMDSMTVMRSVESRATDLNRIHAVNQLSRDFCEGNIDLDALFHRVRDIYRAKSEIKKNLLAMMATTAGFAIMFGAGFYEVLASALAGFISGIGVYGGKKSRDAVVSCELYRVIFAGGHIYSLCSLPAGDHGSERHYHCIDHAPRTGCGDHECGV